MCRILEGKGVSVLNNELFNKDDVVDIKEIYQILSEDIRATKNNQWQMAYYGLLFQAAIIGGFNLLKEIIIPTHGCSTWQNLVLIIFSVVAIIITIFATYKGVNIYNKYQEDLKAYRQLANIIKEGYISKNYRIIRESKELLFIKSEGTDEVNKLFVSIQRSALIVGGVFVLIYLLLFIISLYC